MPEQGAGRKRSGSRAPGKQAAGRRVISSLPGGAPRRFSTVPDRMRFLVMISLAVALIIVVRFTFIMIGPERRSSSLVQSPAISERGPIVDRKGRLIAMQTRLWSITAWKPDIEDPGKTAELLAGILDESPEKLSRLIQSSTSRFVFIKRKASPSESDAVRDLIEAGKLPGIGLQEELSRHYPLKTMAAPLIGYVGTDNVGLDGIEYAFDRTLAPGDLTSDSDRLYGHTVRLTLDMDIQFLVERVAEKAWQQYTPDSLMILVMDAKTAEILSWVSLPSFDPNTFSNSTPEQRIDRPLVSAYEPGSVFKVFSWSSLIDHDAVSPSSNFNTSDGYNPDVFKRFGITPITDLGDYGVLDLTGALVRSSNVAVAMASGNIDAQQFYTSLKNFGFGSPTGLPLPGESHGILSPVKRWSPRSKPTIAIGQEIGVSAVQVITAATTLANGGILLQPRIVMDVTAIDGTVIKKYPRTVVREVISLKTAQRMLNLMEKTVSDPLGTARRAAVDGLRISAKSGTAQIPDPATGYYSEDKVLTSTLALFPTESPRLIVYIVIDNPKGRRLYGAQTAAPMVSEIARATAPLYGVPIEGNTIVRHSGKVRVSNPVPSPLDKTLPDMRGYSKRMILSYMDRSDLIWKINGDGWVVFQFPLPGTPIEKGMRIFLELR